MQILALHKLKPTNICPFYLLNKLNLNYEANSFSVFFSITLMMLRLQAAPRMSDIIFLSA